METVLESKIIHGDAHEILPTLPLNHFRLILADPPYEISRPTNFNTMGRRGMSFGEWDHNFDQFTWITLAAPLLQAGGSCVIWNDWHKIAEIASHLTKLKMNVRRPLIWHKNNPNPANCRVMFVQSTEFAVWATKKTKKDKKVVFNSDYHHGVFKYPLQQSAHPTKKPDKLFIELIEILTNPGDWVLDPFVGSGTTAIACKQLGRNYIGIEKDPEHFKLASEAIDGTS